ncbi:Stk1 family PASTA domain-containing Ser/Thr kinase [Corynebacterium pseudodiphtheriticum]|jgi:probable serine/threonine-protein kinase CE0033|uniref:Stk1 family PASTA domain-containing Ser/Thr kinase n=1 Tax=Corynebacterium pseudodiphtheriticum TaxID=37637 RepID=UPI002542DBD6|nr:Stk1 family PASTA domain-containing Ser/Thr kinase [Corynebacterium pseudodiphtheriticum]MDK4236636.1 Stk1 family PASTA domain-containing Ser/Thr kinase [Corynebacterium pseudodiphtheriticum]MDK4250435.1 Stk1 family PASTA domain-containing Ser/Thr kinase [Corynebacterium pseudodiphtheriticum]MDK4289084.1 Stk1 family PASTA domain-containing Ser/Thr kinase [Corynebacterium pseudodiphtheriticum]MDK8397150.1 Stk1 family PASTA domain-containing Ser/Thr kinase [Corynebacterium pseudodiphtheriticum
MNYSLAQRYELGEIIGSGGMSDVYAAQDTLLGRDVAVKMLRSEMARDMNFRERFRREARNSSKLNHPNIVAVYDTGEETIDGIGIPYIVMERIHGNTLRDLLRNDGPMSPQEAAEILQPVCSALQASHDAGIIHRDIKPANIMLTNTGMVKVMDFGIARALDDSTSAMTQTSAVIGTAQYLSPEQARGKNADARSDVYALGCVLYEAITGGTPFQGETPFAVAYQHVQEDVTPPSERMPEIDLAPTALLNVDAVVMTSMAKHPGDRYQSAAEMGQDLELLSRGSVTQAARAHVAPSQEQFPTQTVGYPETHAAQPQQAYPETAMAGAPGPASAAGTATGAAGALPSNAPGAHTAPPTATTTKPSSHLRWLVAFIVIALLVIGAGYAWSVLNDRDSRRQSDNLAQSETVSVPNIIGLERNEAIAKLEEVGLRPEIVDAPDPEIPEHHVVRTNPSVGSQLQRNTTVTVTVSTGKEDTQVPRLVNMTPQEASAALAEVGLELEPEVDEEFSDSIEQGRITRHEPAAGANLPKGSRVRVTISRGPEIVDVRVPSLTGMKWSQARETLESLGFVPKPQFVDSLEPADRVLGVDGAGQMRPEGSDVRVEVSNGLLTTMPDITRKNRSQALNALRDAGWEASESKLLTGEPVDTAVVTDQGLIAVTSPSPGETIRKDQEINVRFYEFNLRALVP